MQADINRLKDAIKQHGRDPNEDSKALALNIVSSLCQNRDSIRTLKISPLCQSKCALCKKYVNPDLTSSYYLMSCRCFTTFHIKCLQEKALEVSNNFLERYEDLQKITCKNCHAKIPFLHFKMKIFTDAEYKKLVDEQNKVYIEGIRNSIPKIIPEENKIKEVTCANPNCQKKILKANFDEDLVMFQCEHCFCKACARTSIEAQADARAAKIVCIVCKVEIHWETIDRNCDLEKLTDYNIFKLGEEKYVKCGGCKQIFFNEEGVAVRANFMCSNCNLRNLVNPRV